MRVKLLFAIFLMPFFRARFLEGWRVTAVSCRARLTLQGQSLVRRCGFRLLHKPRARRILACGPAPLGSFDTWLPIEAAVAILEIYIIWIRQRPPMRSAKLQSVQALRLRHVQRAEQQGVQGAKDHRVGPDGHGQGCNRHKREAGRLAQQAKSVSNVAPEMIEPRQRPDS